VIGRFTVLNNQNYVSVQTKTGGMSMRSWLVVVASSRGFLGVRRPHYEGCYGHGLGVSDIPPSGTC
jgi:hypothetical protein